MVSIGIHLTENRCTTQGVYLEQILRITKTFQVEVGLKTDGTKPNKESEVELGCIHVSLKGLLRGCVGSVAYHSLFLCLDTLRTGSEFSC